MSDLKSYDYPGWGEYARENMAYTQAIRVGDRIHCSGQGGWEPSTKYLDVSNPEGVIKTDLAEEIDRAFANCDLNLRHAGGKGFEQVYRIVTYSTDVNSSFEHLVRNLRKWMPDRKPVWTHLGVKALGLETMHIEIDVDAYDPEGAAAA